MVDKGLKQMYAAKNKRSKHPGKSIAQMDNTEGQENKQPMNNKRINNTTNEE